MSDPNHGGNPQAPNFHSPHAPPLRPAALPPGARPGITPVPTMAPPRHDEPPLTLIEDRQPGMPHPMAGPPAPKKITAFGAADVVHKKHDWKRTPNTSGTGAVRVKSFHGKYSEAGLEYLDNAINEWLDSHPEVEVKFVTPTVMTFEGKIREPALVLNLWY